MEIKELKNKNISELQAILRIKRDKLRELRFKDAAKQLKNIRELRMIKKDIAQILTLINVKEYGK
ncbi:50S ribosomal protein L29 [Candidatus Falkowbacteria bacterium CG10_big_fil_rev_8_21_14_0_10_43_11]|uniref:Large ribosomal subunit protein uL29 n=1 Tax=Candidatus Falkowbacteria bacterium CG10_big_fil_rev_8_21_14_0_10_43_11 TaxID=1974568 RepID=A0A2M6WLP3_9BACT|nr:MAG: 50S ribosomal protein L29 [Candidatus Falkowbacteria bacterium CG10_big_fil_rev_8_21_14_0_10_43_11]